jgi:hypothetical protein
MGMTLCFFKKMTSDFQIFEANNLKYWLKLGTNYALRIVIKKTISYNVDNFDKTMVCEYII